MSVSQRVSLDRPRVRHCTITVEGVVQGIGFRPSVYRLAVSHRLAGSVRNSRTGVLIEAEGDDAALDAFLTALGDDAPGKMSVAWREPEGLAGFSIADSARDGIARFSPAPDRAVCDACAARARRFRSSSRPVHRSECASRSCGVHGRSGPTQMPSRSLSSPQSR